MTTNKIVPQLVMFMGIFDCQEIEQQEPERMDLETNSNEVELFGDGMGDIYHISLQGLEFNQRKLAVNCLLNFYPRYLP